MKSLLALALPLCWCMSLPISAQELSPMLVITAPGEAKPVTLGLTKVEVQARIFGFLAETRMTMTFTNPFDRQLEGNLYFPLPEGVTVSGYALDVNGALVDGVVVEKEKAQIVFEKEVRKGVDPGLVEWVKGNNFKTRVYPIPSRGTRTIAVRYVSELSFTGDAASYSLPMGFKDKLEQFSLRVDVLRAPAAPSLSWTGPAPLEFKQGSSGYFVETSVRNTALTGVIKVNLPEARKQGVLVERSPEGETHFCLSDFPVDPRRPEDHGVARAPVRVRILWDASGSRAGADHQREFDMLRTYFGRFKDAKVVVELVLFNNESESPQGFVVENGNADKLIQTLKQVIYDGGTQMASVSPGVSALPVELNLLFSDGISNFGREQPAGFKSPVYAFSADPGANHPFLRRLAQETGGEYFNLNQVDDKTAVAAIGVPAFQFMSAELKSGRASQVLPGPEPVHGHFTLAGKLDSETASLQLNYGLGGKVLQSVRFDLAAKDAVEGDLLARLWAQKKLSELMVFAQRNERELTALGKRYGLVTPGTSLMVLERLEQYLEHEIPPPRSLPEWRRQYEQAIAQKAQQKRQEEQSKLDAVVKLWQGRVEWWNTKFSYPPNLKMAAEPAKSAEAPSPRMLSLGSAPSSQAVDDRSVEREESMPQEKSMAKKDLAGKDSAGAEPAIALKPWDPQTPYLAALKASPQSGHLDVYLQKKKEFGGSPAFYLDCADFFIKQKDGRLAMRVLSNIAEMELSSAPLQRILAHRLAQLGKLEYSALVFEEVLRLRPEEPQSYRDLALVLADLKQYPRAIELLAHVIMNRWDRFSEIELIALMEINRIIPLARAAGIKDIPLDPRLIKLLDLDIRISLTWDADLTDIDLWVTEPSGEKAYYSHNRTTIGGLVSRDFTQGYGPEEYILRKAMHGIYKVETNFFGSSAQSLSGAVTLQLDIFTNYGRKNEKKKSITLRLTGSKETFTVGELEF